LDNVAVLPVEDFQPTLTTGVLFRADRANAGGDLSEVAVRARRIFHEVVTV
jgi:hypothetical protein